MLLRGAQDMQLSERVPVTTIALQYTKQYKRLTPVTVGVSV